MAHGISYFFFCECAYDHVRIYDEALRCSKAVQLGGKESGSIEKKSLNWFIDCYSNRRLDYCVVLNNGS